MKLSVKSDYAARAVLGLVRHYAGAGSVRVEQLGAEQGIPPKFLVQILLELKAAGIVRSLRGKEGGYLLARPPAEVTLGHVIRAIHGTIFFSPALDDPACPAALRGAWRQVQESVERAADAITFQQLSEEPAEKMYYI